MSRLSLRGALCAAAVLAASPAFAHVTLEQQQANSGSYYKAVLKVPHGCGDAATTGIKVTIPEGVVGAKPQPKAGWTLATETGPYAKAYEVMHGPPAKEGVKTISWSGGSLPDAFYDEFVFIAYLPPQTEATTLYFPVVQSCGATAENWTDIPAAGAPRPAKPAPGLKLAAATTAPAAQVKLGNLVISAPWTRATPGGAKVAGGYVAITNTGSTPDKLVGGSFEQSGRFEVHEMSMKDGVMTMRPVSGGLDIQPGQTVTLSPGGLHFMFLDLKEPLKEGAKVKGTLTFEKAGSTPVTFDVLSLGAGAPPAGGGMGGMGGMPMGGMDHQH